MAMKLRRFHKRKQAEKKRRDAMTQDLDDDDDDDDLDQKPTTTILEQSWMGKSEWEYQIIGLRRRSMLECIYLQMKFKSNRICKSTEG